jgi:hypothetical protein
MTPGYNSWYMHGETASGSAVGGRCSSHPNGTDSAAGSYEQGEFSEQERGLEQGGNMRAMLRDAFGMHDVAEAVSRLPQQVDEGTSGGDALKAGTTYHECEPLVLATAHLHDTNDEFEYDRPDIDPIEAPIIQ